MLKFPNAKINIGLNIVEKRNDGYHNIESVFYPIALSDALEIVESNELKFTNSGQHLDALMEDNLCVKAYRLLQKQYDIPNVHIHLHKNIPFGAGLGGGSSDASFVINMLNEIFELSIDSDKMKSLALEIGSDCPFFIDNVPMYVWGRGEYMEKLNISLSGKFLVLINPRIHIGTKEAYSGVVPKNPDFCLKHIVDIPIKDWKKYVKNDFEKSIFPKFPQIEDIKNKLYNLGAEYSSMSGSGSSVFAIFDNEVNIDSVFGSYYVYKGFI